MWTRKIGLFVVIMSSLEASLDLSLIEKTIRQFEASQGDRVESGSRFVILLPAGQSLVMPSKTPKTDTHSETRQAVAKVYDGSPHSTHPKTMAQDIPLNEAKKQETPLTGTDFLAVPHKEMPDFLKNTGTGTPYVVLSPQAVGPRSFVTEVPTPTLNPRPRTYTNYWKHTKAYDRVPEPEAYSWHMPPSVPQMPNDMRVPPPRFSAPVHGAPISKSGPYVPPMPDFGCNILLED